MNYKWQMNSYEWRLTATGWRLFCNGEDIYTSDTDTGLTLAQVARRTRNYRNFMHLIDTKFRYW